ncbi:hypothetical protein [Variovorax sp. PAMC26660]|uniref:hypothetical protein n=1 Tax=Variovorax sp. PAMC26660 TaxID=2762322 RepID=UPI00164D196D|nr:hypothetical protein [Variovorax sp. PAMC26660]QNK69738.1 hypothetical protein H7F35_08625 [Variovorax sp. PAMC26660]
MFTPCSGQKIRRIANERRPRAWGTDAMRNFYTVELFEVVVLAIALLLASVAAAEVVSGFDQEPPVYDPCRDGRNSYGRAMDCGELLRQMDRDEERERRRRDDAPDRRVYDPCRDGRYSTGRAIECDATGRRSPARP